MEIMEVIKFVMMYGLEIVVVALVGITVLAGLYQLVRDRVRQPDTPTVSAETVRR